MVALPFAGSFPVDQTGGQLFPIAAALDRDVADAFADNLVLADDLIGAVFEDEAMVGSHARHTGLEGKRRLSLGWVLGRGGNSGQQQDRQGTGKQTPQMKEMSH